MENCDSLQLLMYITSAPFSGLFDKAKRKILGKEQREDGAIGFAQAYPEDIPTSTNTFDAGGIDPAMWEPQELGNIPFLCGVSNQICYSRATGHRQ